MKSYKLSYYGKNGQLLTPIEYQKKIDIFNRIMNEEIQPFVEIFKHIKPIKKVDTRFLKND